MATSSKKKASARLRAHQIGQNRSKRGQVSKGTERTEKSPFGPIVIGFFLFVVVGSALFQIIRTAQTAGGSQ